MQGTILILAAVAAACCLFSGLARADDQPFLAVYSTDIDSKGEREVEQWLGWKTGQRGASYNDFLSRNELEYGITDDVQGSLYFNYEWQQLQTHSPPFHSATESAVGLSGELIWRLLNVDFAPFGLALYAEPAWSSNEAEVETKVLLQKNFLNDRLRWVTNVNFEDDWDRDSSTWTNHSALEFDMGLTYAVRPQLSAGFEFDNERAFDGLVMGGSARELASAFFLGPTINFEPVPWKITIGTQAQLPWATSPAGNPGRVADGFSTDAERFRLALRISRDF